MKINVESVHPLTPFKIPLLPAHGLVNIYPLDPRLPESCNAVLKITAITRLLNAQISAGRQVLNQARTQVHSIEEARGKVKSLRERIFHMQDCTDIPPDHVINLTAPPQGQEHSSRNQMIFKHRITRNRKNIICIPYS